MVEHGAKLSDHKKLENASEELVQLFYLRLGISQSGLFSWLLRRSDLI